MSACTKTLKTQFPKLVLVTWVIEFLKFLHILTIACVCFGLGPEDDKNPYYQKCGPY